MIERKPEDWKSEILNKSPLLKAFLGCDMRFNDWFSNISPLINNIIRSIPDDLDVTEIMWAASGEVHKFGDNVLDDYLVYMKNRLELILLYIGYELEDEDDAIHISMDIVDKIDEAKMFDCYVDQDLQHNMVCDILSRGIQMKQEINSVLSFPPAFREFVNTLDL